MKTQKVSSLKLLTVTLLGFATSMMVACNKDSGGGGTAAAPAAVAAVSACGSGYVQSSSYGCLPQGSCPVNHGVYQNQCIAINTSTTNCTVGSVSHNGQCLPQGNCAAGQAFNGSSCIVVTTVTQFGTTPQPFPGSGVPVPVFNPAYGAYNNGYYGNVHAWNQVYSQPVQQPYFYQQAVQQPYFYQPPFQSCGIGCGGGGGAGVGFYFGLRL